MDSLPVFPLLKNKIPLFHSYFWNKEQQGVRTAPATWGKTTRNQEQDAPNTPEALPASGESFQLCLGDPRFSAEPSETPELSQDGTDCAKREKK